jgi:hypothetical protein
MYRIQAYNFVKKAWRVQNVATMTERDAFIKMLIETDEFKPAGITWEWLARH